MKNVAAFLCRGSNLLTHTMNILSSVFLLLIRIYMAQIFLWSGWLKLNSWQATINLFEYEYTVPYLSPVVAAFLGTGSEVIFTSLLLVGLGSRLPALILFFVNIVMLVSYPILMTAEGSCMAKDHYLWGLAFLIIIFFGHGKISLDYLIQRKVCKEYKI